MSQLPGVNINLTTVTQGATVYVANQVPVQVGSITVTGSTYTSVTNFPASQPVTGTFWQATQPTSVSNWPGYYPGYQNIFITSGSITVGNLPNVQQVYWSMPQDVGIVGTADVNAVNFSSHVIVDNQVSVATHTSVDNFPAGLATNATLTGGNQVTQIADGSGHTLNIDPSGTARVNVISMPSVTGTVSVSNFPAASTFTYVNNFSSHVIVDNQVTVSTHVTVDNQVTVSTHVTVDNFPASQAVTGIFFQATQPISGSVSVSNFPATQPVSGAVSVSNFPATQAVTVPLFPSVLVYAPLSISVSATAATGVAVTATLPAVAAQFHYVQYLEIEAYSTAARTGVATPILCTSANLMSNPSWTFATAAAIGTTDTHTYNTGFAPIKSAVVNTATTVTCPATTGVIWRINMFYYTGA